IDGLLNIASEDTVLLHACQVHYEVVDRLKKKGFKILETPSLTETKYGYATNFVAIDNGHVVTSNLAPQAVELLEKNGITVDVLDLSELNKGRGSVHCMTAFLKRD
ncbi:MAG: amidinotransferase, partial [Firmicutes bacterium]|nr:amidinotransferase [Bacillota bacterium]